MSKVSKTIVIIGIIIFWLFISIFNIEGRESSGHKSPGIGGIVLMLGMVAAVRAVWKYETNSNNNNEIDKHKLDKKL